MKAIATALRGFTKTTVTKRPAWSPELVALLRDSPSRVRAHLERAAKRSVLASGMREAEAEAFVAELREEADRG